VAFTADDIPLDERIERLRKGIPKDRRPSVADLIALADISRSRWYRVMAGEVDLTVPEGTRLARALETTLEELIGGADQQQSSWEPSPRDAAPGDSGELRDFVANIDQLIRALSPGGEVALETKAKLAILNGIEEAARLAGQSPPAEFYDIRRAVNEGRM
jgi:hypothetical protein